MTRQKALNKIWAKLLTVFIVLVTACIAVIHFGGTSRIPALVFLFGNMGAYVSAHKSLGELKDDEVIGLSESWLGLVVPSFVGGILAFILYILFLSKIVGGDLFPLFVPDTGVKPKETIDTLGDVHLASAADYAKLFFWSFLGGFNQKYAVDIIQSVKAKA